MREEKLGRARETVELPTESYEPTGRRGTTLYVRELLDSQSLKGNTLLRGRARRLEEDGRRLDGGFIV